MEAQYSTFFGLLQEHKIRLRLLILNFLIMLYSVVEWFSAEVSHPEYLIVTRVIWLVVNFGLFIISLVKRELYRTYIQSFCAILIASTSLLILTESILLNVRVHTALPRLPLRFFDSFFRWMCDVM